MSLKARSLVLGLSIVFTFVLSTASTVVAQSSNQSALLSQSEISSDQLAQDMLKHEALITSNDLLVKYKNNRQSDQTFKQTLSNRLGSNNIRFQSVNTGTGEIQMINLESRQDLKNALATALSNPTVDFAQPLYRYKLQAYTPADADFNSRQWYLKDGPGLLNAQSGWEYLGDRFGVTCSTSTSGKQCGGQNSVKIAVIDSGVNPNMSDGPTLDPVNTTKIYYNQDNSCDEPYEVVFQSGVRIDDGSGIRFVNFCQASGLSYHSDNEGHGTAVAGVAAMNHNTVGGVGVAFNTQIISIALHGDYTWNSLTISKAVDYAVSKGAKVINMSFGGPSYDPIFEAAINRASNAGVTMTASAGNCFTWSLSSCDFNGNGRADPDEINPIIYPAGFSNVIAVGASNYGTNTNPYNAQTNPQGIRRSAYSEVGNNVFVSAPVGDGSNSPSGNWAQCGVIPSQVGLACFGKSVGQFDAFLGTSFSSPQVAGLIALMYSLNQNLSTPAVRSILAATATDVGQPGFDPEFGHGIVNIDRTLRRMFGSLQSDFNGSAIDQVENAVFQSKLYQIVRGTNNKIYTRSSANGISDWSAWETDSVGVTQNPVAAAVFNNKLYQAVRGLDNKIYTRSSTDGTNYTAWVVDPVSNTPEGIEMLTFQTSLYQFARGTADRIYIRSTSDGQNWTNWVDYGGTTPSAISTTVFSNQICMAVRGSSDNKIYTRCTGNPTNWPNWIRDDSSFTLLPIVMGVNGLKWYQSAIGSGGRIYTRERTINTDWLAWTDQGGVSPNTPNLISFNDQLFQTIRGYDNNIYWRTKD